MYLLAEAIGEDPADIANRYPEGHRLTGRVELDYGCFVEIGVEGLVTFLKWTGLTKTFILLKC